jgi:thioesterase domain-containing protein
LLESVPPGKHPVRFGREAARAFAGNVHCWLSDLARTTPGELLGRLERKGAALIKKTRRLFLKTAPKESAPGLADLIDMDEYPKDYVRFAQAHWQALLSYRPAPYTGRVTLFRARKQPLMSLDPTLGWSRLAEGGVALNVIPGTHEKMLEEPNVQILATELKACLAEAQAEREARTPESPAPTARHPKAIPHWNCSVVT